MAATVKVMRRPKRESSYLRASLKGMALTFRHMLASAGDRSTVTIQYPE
jgi:NADH-quinone oxidoreductase subunit I